MRHHLRGTDRGVSAVIVALTLTSVMAVSAFAVDFGQAYAERRHDQNTVDAAAMSGLVEGTLTGGSVNDIVAEVRDKVDTTLGRVVPDEEWLDCEDSEQLTYTTKDLNAANYEISPVTDCISFSIAFDELRVRLPKQEVVGVFGPALGFGNLSVDAAANAMVEAGPGTGGPPFVALSTATTGDFVCLRTTSAKEPIPLANGNGPGVAATFPTTLGPGVRPDPCDSTQFATASENFGTLLPWRYRTGCTRTGNVDVEIAISIGIDHIMGVFAHGYDPLALPSDPHYEEKTTERIDGGGGCTVAYPNTFEVDTGLNSGGLDCALIDAKDGACNGEVPRLQQGPYVQTTHKIVNSSHDNSAPWTFLRPAAELYQGVKADECQGAPSGCASDPAPDACVGVAASRTTDDFNLVASDIPAYKNVPSAGDSYWDHYDRFDALVQCLQEWEADRLAWHNDPTSGLGPPELFGEDLATSSRFAFIPQVAENTLDKVDYVHIEGFRPVYMYRLYVQETGKMCDPSDPRSTSLKVHDAGQPWSCASGNKTVDRLASIIFACGMVPDTLCNKETGIPSSSGGDIYEFRLTK